MSRTDPGGSISAHRKRASKRALRAYAAAAGLAAFLLPWAAIKAAPKPVASVPPVQVVYAPPGSHVMVRGAGKNAAVKVVGGPAAGTAPVATTGGSHPVH